MFTRFRRRIGFSLSVVAFAVLCVSNVVCFQPVLPQWSRQSYRGPLIASNPLKQPSRMNDKSSATSLNSFMGSDGGLLGVGTPELVRAELPLHSMS